MSSTTLSSSLLFLNIFIVAMCGLVYELLGGTLASYLLGDSVTQFSLTIGIYLSALGVGAWLSGHVHEPARVFIEVEMGVALLGGLSAPILFLGFASLAWFHALLYGTIFAIGILVGLELPLLMRILQRELEFKELVARALAFDYIGALVASLAFPILLVPDLGLMRTSMVFGLANALVALWGTWLLQHRLRGSVGGLRVRGVIVIAVLLAALVKAGTLTHMSEVELYSESIVHAETSAYQRIVVTSDQGHFKLFLNGSLQFASRDEYRYHEALVHPAMTSVTAPRDVLILGGGDGLALREVLRYRTVERVTLVDLDPAMTRLAREFSPLVDLNEHSLADPRVHVVNQDAMVWLDEVGPLYDVAIVDFPDPNNFSLGKLYTTRFHELLWHRLRPEAAVGMQCTSPLFSRRSFWCIIETLRQNGSVVTPYQTTVPSFGIWGFALVRKAPADAGPAQGTLPEGLRFLDAQSTAALYSMPPDLGPVPVEVNRLDNQVLVRYYDQEWKKWY